MTAPRNLAVLGAGTLVAAGTIYVILVSRYESEPALAAALLPAVGVSFVGSGLIAWNRQRDNWFGPLMIGVGFAWALAALQDANASTLFTLGVLVGNVAFAGVAHAALAFPTGRLDGRWSRLAIAAAYVDVTLLQAIEMLFDAHPNGTPSPRNVLLVGRSSAAATAIADVQRAIGAAVALFVLWRLGERWWRATATQRRALTPVVGSGGAFCLVIALELISATVSSSVGDLLHLVLLATLASVPLALLFALLRSRLARVAIGQLVIELREAPEPARVRAALARALRDPSLELAFWLPASRRFVDLDGATVDLPPEGGPRVATLVEHEGRRVAALVHDRAVCDEPQLLAGVTAAAALALENARLQAELHAQLAALARERDFSHAIVRTTPSLLVVLDREGRFVQFNAACEELSGYTFEEVVGRRFWDLFIDEDEREGIERAFAELDATGRPSRNENHWRTRDGRRRLVVWRNAALRDADGHVTHVVSGGVDVTDVRRQEAELKASRQRILDAGIAERRRLERNLHDGAQQRLVALSLALRLAKARLAARPDEAARLLDTASEELAQALEELRELARGIHPAILTDRGLDAALEALAARAPLPVDVDARLAERLPPAVEAAAYYVVAEGLTNVVKYAHASAARVSVSHVDGAAVVEVADDGVGGADPGAGSGLAGLRDRVEALDGRLRVESEPGRGTHLVAEIPCA